MTGERAALSSGLAEFVERVRKVSTCPLAVGFGISTPQQAQAVARLADGVIIGSALISAAGKAGTRRKRRGNLCKGDPGCDVNFGSAGTCDRTFR